MKISLQTHSRCWDKKPTGVEAGKMRHNFKRTEVELDELVQIISKGRTFIPAVLDDTKSNGFISQQIFAVDFDNDRPGDRLAPQQVFELYHAQGFIPFAWYYTFSSTPEHEKFRFVFVCANAVTDKQMRDDFQQALIEICHQSDTTCKDASRMLYATDKGVYVTDPDAVFTWEDMTNYYKRKKDGVAKKPVEQTPKNQPINVNTNMSLEKLKAEFPLFEYMKSRNGAIHAESGNYTQFKTCELCGGKEDLTYYHETNSYKCFGGKSGGNTGGSCIDYIMNSEKVTVNEAISKAFKHMGIDPPSKKAGKHFVIIPQVYDENILAKLIELQPHLNYQADDKGWAKVFADVFIKFCRYNVPAKKWYVYNGKFWERVEGIVHVLKYAFDLVDALIIYAINLQDGRAETYLECVAKLGNLDKRKRLLDDAKTHLAVDYSYFDRNTNLFNCQNGTYDLSTMKLHSHNSDDFLSKITNVVFDPDATSELFVKFMDDVMQSGANNVLTDEARQEKIEYIQKILGLSLTADTSAEQSFIFYGSTSRNGKSTLVETFAYMLGNNGGYAMTIKPESLAARSKDGRSASGDIARLDGCRFLNCPEPNKRMQLDPSLFKQITGRDLITARHLFESEFEFMPHFKLIMNTNYLPNINDDTLFASGRINVVTFDRHFTKKEQVTDLKDNLRKPENISGIFNWCLEGLRKFRKHRLKPPQCVLDATQEYRETCDKVGNFIKDCLVPVDSDTHGVIQAATVYKYYKAWCIENGYMVEGRNSFFTDLRAKGLLHNSGTVGRKTIRNVIRGYDLSADLTADDYEILSARRNYS